MVGSTITSSGMTLPARPECLSRRLLQRQHRSRSEALFRTLKYRPEYPCLRFGSLEEARCWVERFVRWSNSEHRHSAIRFVTPQVRHAGEESEVLQRRKEVYEEAKRRNPSRWSGRTRNWSPVAEVILNPVRRRGENLERASA
jgi:putative transposase